MLFDLDNSGATIILNTNILPFRELFHPGHAQLKKIWIKIAR